MKTKFVVGQKVRRYQGASTPKHPTEEYQMCYPLDVVIERVRKSLSNRQDQLDVQRGRAIRKLVAEGYTHKQAVAKVGPRKILTK